MLDELHTISLFTLICIPPQQGALIPNSADQFATSATHNAIFGLQTRNREAEKLIARYAKNHRWLDVGVGLVGTFVPIPGATLAAMLACVAVQGPLFYKPMANELAKIYTSPVDHHTKRIVSEVTFEGASWDIAAEFNTNFLVEIAGELITELGWGAAAAAIPFLGGVIGATLDALVATTMTWRVGTMISIYYQNNGAWLGGRRESFEVARDFVGKPSMKAENRVDLDEVAKKHRQVLNTQLVTLKSVLLDPLLEVAADEVQIMAVLKGRGLSEELIESAMMYVRSVMRSGPIDAGFLAT